MTAPTKATMLENVETAINNIAAGGAVQSYSIGGRNLQRYTLTELLKLRDQLKKEIASESGTGTRTYVQFERPI